MTTNGLKGRRSQRTITTEDQAQAFLESLSAPERLKVEWIVREFMRLSEAEKNWVIQSMTASVERNDAKGQGVAT